MVAYLDDVLGLKLNNFDVLRNQSAIESCMLFFFLSIDGAPDSAVVRYIELWLNRK